MNSVHFHIAHYLNAHGQFIAYVCVAWKWPFPHMPIDKRQFIEKRVQLMSGCYHEDLNTNTSVLVSDSVLTKKSTYSCDKPHIYRDNRMDRIMLGQISTWIQTIANEESIISKYRLPILHGLNIVFFWSEWTW